MFEKHFLLSFIFFFCIMVSSPGSARQYSEKELFTGSKVRSFTGQYLSEIAFPIGGIGTGTVSLGGRGDLRDWEIFNRPGKNKDLGFTFFAIWAETGNGGSIARILERKLIPPYKGGFGTPQNQLTGVARIDEAVFRGEYPFAWIDFIDKKLPVKVQLEVWNPFIPLNVKDSALPVAIFFWKIVNPTYSPVKVSIAASIFNPVGTDGVDFGGNVLGKNVNEYIEEGGFRGLKLYSERLKKEDVTYGNMALVTTWEHIDVQTHWYRGGWWDYAHIFWDDFADDGRITPLKLAEPSPDRRSDVGSIVLYTTIPAQGSVTFPFFLTWYFPNRENYWNREKEVKGKKMKNFVADQFSNAVDVAKYVVENLNRLEKETKLWHDTFFSSSLPSYVLDAVSSQVSTIRTNTCMLLADGSFFAFEGCGDNAGCCPMNCTHVWNYEQSLAHLFPSLERSMRNTDFLHNIREDNSMAFRTLIPLGPYHWKYKPAADGQMGCVMKAYREWKFSGDTEWLRTIWPGVKKALEYAWTKEKGWDPNKDGVMEGEQHNTYDIEFYGPNTMMGSLYLGALKAASEMARALGETEKANEYLSLYKKGSRIYDSELWNGSYFIQKVKVMPGIEVPERLRTPENIRCACKQPPGGKKVSLEKGEVIPKYQYGEGCLSDQLLGQWFAYVSGLGNLLSPEHTKKAVKSIFDYNWRRHIGDFSNVQRVYALNDDAGLLLCTWPFGKRPKLPFVYSDEVWTGIEYQVAAHLIYEGWLKEGLSIVKGVRDRYDGLRRNPWDEVECGHHYARAMSSWSLLLALSGAHYDGIEKSITFGPRINREDFQCFWSAGSGWGKFKESVQNDNLKSSLIIEYGELNIKQFTLNNLRKLPKNAKVKLNNQELEFEIKTEDKSCTVIFSKILKMQKDDVLIVEF